MTTEQKTNSKCPYCDIDLAIYEVGGFIDKQVQGACLKCGAKYILFDDVQIEIMDKNDEACKNTELSILQDGDVYIVKIDGIEIRNVHGYHVTACNEGETDILLKIRHKSNKLQITSSSTPNLREQE